MTWPRLATQALIVDDEMFHHLHAGEVRRQVPSGVDCEGDAVHYQQVAGSHDCLSLRGSFAD